MNYQLSNKYILLTISVTVEFVRKKKVFFFLRIGIDKTLFKIYHATRNIKWLSILSIKQKRKY